jgi:hypothetical protein
MELSTDISPITRIKIENSGSNEQDLFYMEI